MKRTKPTKSRVESFPKRSGCSLLWILLRSLVLLSLVALGSGCSRTDWELSTNLLPHKTTISPTNPQYDVDGNLIVSPEISNTYRMPDIHAGVALDWNFKRVRPVIEMEMFEFKAPYVRYNEVGVFAGDDLIGIHLSHRWTSIVEFNTGVFGGYDTMEHHSTFGLSLLMIKF